MVRWSHCDFLTAAAHIGYLADSSLRMILKRTECFWLPNLFVFLRWIPGHCPQKISSFYLKKWNDYNSVKLLGLIINIRLDSAVNSRRWQYFFFKITGRKFIAGLVKWSATCSKLYGVLVEGGLVLASKIFFPENGSWLDGRIANF